MAWRLKYMSLCALCLLHVAEGEQSKRAKLLNPHHRSRQKWTGNQTVSTTVVLDMSNPRAGEKPRDVVMGLVTNHIWEVIPGGIGLFIVSLRQSGYHGDIVLGVDTKQAKDPKILQNFKTWKCTAVLADATQYDPNFLPKKP